MTDSTVLVIEDEPSLRHMISALLETRGFAVDAVDGGAVGLDRLTSRRYAAIVLDLVMPAVNGLEVLQYIRLWRPLWLRRVIVLTALSASLVDRIEERRDLGAVLRKPFDADSLARQVLECVTGSSIVEAGGDSIDSALARFREASPEAQAGLVAIARGAWLGTIVAFGKPEGTLIRNAFVHLDEIHPFCDCFRSGEPVWISDAKALGGRYAGLATTWVESGTQAVAAAPIVCERVVRGIAAWAFSEPQLFDEGRRCSLRSLAEQCGPLFALS